MEDFLLKHVFILFISLVGVIFFLIINLNYEQLLSSIVLRMPGDVIIHDYLERQYVWVKELSNLL